jgi:hypothetical protein
MAPRKSRPGTCVLCERNTHLTYEHVPPRAAFNRGTVTVSPHGLGAEEAWQPPGTKIRGKQVQGGVGYYALCASCNNFLGTHYVRAYADWTWQLAHLQPVRDGRLLLHFQLKPLNILKQILAMFCVVNASYRGLHERVRHFILNPCSQQLPDDIRVFAYCCFGKRVRIHDLMAKCSLSSSDMRLYSEISMSPLGVALEVQGQKPDPRIMEITYFKEFPFDAQIERHMNVPNLAVESPLPLDFRTWDQIEADRRANEQAYPEAQED